MSLSLETRDIGRVTVVRCSGRVVTGAGNESLLAHINWLLHDRTAIVLHLGDVTFIDSSGLGTLVRALTSVRRKGGDLKLCNLGDHTRKVLDMTNLIQLFDTHDSEESAISAFYRAPLASEPPARKGPSLLCVEQNASVLAYLRELLRRTGYEVQTINNLHDALILMKVTHFHLLLLGPELKSSAATQRAFEEACAKVAVVRLEAGFSEAEAGEAASALLGKISACLNLSSLSAS